MNSAPLDLSRWQDKPNGVTYRRWVIVETGLRQLLRTRFFRFMLVVAWTAGVLVAAAGFLFAQSVSPGGWIETWAAQLGPRPQAIGSAACAMILLYPDICLTGLYSAVFWAHSFVGLGLALLALTVVIPRLVARDRSCNALTIYLSRPLTSTDYLLGKLGVIIGILLLIWTGPLLCGWLLSMLFAPGRDFLVYSLSPLLRALLFNGLSLGVLAAIALGVSSLGRTTRNTILLWIGVWMVAGWIARFPGVPDWLRYASFGFDLDQARQAIFRLDEILAHAANSLPLLDSQLTQTLTKASQAAQSHHLPGALLGLALLAGGACVVFFRRLRPE
ncbi:MAG: hypothetical protein IPL39_06860 [Opitutaceae bacterium]|nr:hypothetical protein [Opitutaceae bacterium]